MGGVRPKMEYPPNSTKTWRVVAYDRNGSPMLMQEKLTRWVAEKLAEQWFSRTDTSRVEGYDASTH